MENPYLVPGLHVTGSHVCSRYDVAGALAALQTKHYLSSTECCSRKHVMLPVGIAWVACLQSSSFSTILGHVFIKPVRQ